MVVKEDKNDVLSYHNSHIFTPTHTQALRLFSEFKLSSVHLYQASTIVQLIYPMEGRILE